MRAYAVILDWSTSDDSHVDIELFDTYTKAYHRFNEIIKNEKILKSVGLQTPSMSTVKS